MHDVAQGRQGFVRREQHRPALQVPFIDDPVEHIRGVDGVREIAQLVDDEHMRLEIRLQRGIEPALARRARELADQDVGPDEAGVVAVLNGAIGDRDAEVRLPRATRAREDRVPSLAHQFGSQVAAKHLQLERGLKREVEIVDRAEKGEARLVHGPRETGFAAVGASDR